MKKTFQTHYSRMAIPYEQRICEATKVSGISQTVPDQILPLRTLVQRYVQRRDVPMIEGVYLDEDSILNDFHPENMDIEERLEFALAIGHAVSDEKRKMKKASPVPAPDGAPAPVVRDDIAGV